MPTKPGEGFGATNPRNHMTGPQAKLAGSLRVVPISSVRPNQHNYNVQSATTFNKLVENVREFGFVEPIIVRTLADGSHEIINGEHRYHGAKQLGMEEVSIVDLGEVSDARAKQLTITLNELGGKPDQVRLAELLREIHIDEGIPLVDLERIMPYSDKELGMLITAVDFSFANLSDQDTRRPVPPEEGHAPESPNGAPETAQGGVSNGQGASEVKVTVGFVYEASQAVEIQRRLAAVTADPEKALEKLLDYWEQKPAGKAAKKKGSKTKPAEQGSGEAAEEAAQES